MRKFILFLFSLFIVLSSCAKNQRSLPSSQEKSKGQQEKTSSKEDPFLYFEQGIQKENQGDHQEAIEYYKNAIALSPKIAVFYYHLGKIYFKKKKTNEAVLELQKTIQLNPQHYDAHNQIGRIYKFNKNFKKSIEYYTRAIQIDPKRDMAYSLRATSLMQIGEYEKAIKDLSTAIKIAHHPLDYRHRGSAYIKLGRIINACKNWKISCNLNHETACNYANSYCQGVPQEEINHQ